ncbi:sugar transferase [Roseovarius sp. MMSF_3281]|uniref:sugar transferase n=1 Tax=Roseovarius sp. MMSF_3281 TaxID=3046694 RepID=UPI00273FB217|nr:sugar transferase [Roseovarius sp. MMSF_3281]
MKDSIFIKGSFDDAHHFETIGAAPDGTPLRVHRHNVPVDRYEASASVGTSRIAHRLYRDHGKRFLDVAFVLATLPITLPITLICAFALWIEGGQPFYRQDRLGARGKTFSILKLRTMSRNAEQDLKDLLAKDDTLRREWETTQKLKNDPRITRVGAFLRSTSLDELPQFLNVMKGDMSVVGPRPMMPNQLSLYPNPAAYFALRPGVTGAWQISDRNENSFAFRATVDARYDAALSFFGDLKIIAKTVGVVLRRTGY